ncbi:MAG TPA: response regulator [Burkholderiales bacterium]|nr:response regulator [Burkholderiales bacterium]
MPKRDLEEALNLYAALMRLVVTQPGARNDTEGMRRLSHVCARAVEIVNDVEARVLIRGVESRAKLLFSQDGHVGVAAGSLEGVAALKFQIYNALSNLRGRLQALQDREPPSRPELPALQPGKGGRVLVVEDDHDSALSLRRLLEFCGYTVSVAFSGREGMETAEKISPDVVLCDIGLPDTDGYQLATALRNNPSTARVRLIAVTAYGSEQDRQRSREAGFQLHLVKPVKPEKLLEELDKAPKLQANG